MKTNYALILVTALACGGSSNDPLDPAMAGTWNGTTTLTFSGQSPQSASGQLQVAVSGQNATFSEVCLDGSGSIAAHGSGRSASWQGTYACQPVAFTNCSSVVLTYQSASATLNGSTLSAQGAGSAAGCGINTTFTLGFTGTK